MTAIEIPELTEHNGALWMWVGTMTKCGTDWPIETKIEKVGRRWQVTFGLCDGLAGAVRLYTTKQEAYAAARQDFIEREEARRAWAQQLDAWRPS
jgi:hypothetical protein